MHEICSEHTSDIQVTVWCLAYNHEKYIRRTLEGFVSQKVNFRFEVLIHDDASTDHTADIIREYEKMYPDLIKPIYQTQNQYSQGIKPSEHYLRPYAKGKYIAFCEGDDYWCDPEKLQRQFDVMEKNPDVILCVHKVACINEDGSPNPHVFPEKTCGLHNDQILTQEQFAALLFTKCDYPFHTSSYFHRRELWDSELNQKLRGVINGDQRVLRSALIGKNVYYIDSVMSKRRMQSVGNWNQRFSVLPDEKKLEYMKKHFMGDVLVDTYTEHKFHKLIAVSFYQKLCMGIFNYGKSKTISTLGDFRKKYRLRDVGFKKVLFKYLLIQMSPKLVSNLVQFKQNIS